MNQGTIAKALNFLIDRKKISIQDLAHATGVKRSSLYALTTKTTNQVDLNNLKVLADYFGEDISIFCGLDDYKPPIKLSNEESLILTIFRTLNATGKDRLIQYVKELGDNPKMKGKA